MPGKPFGEAPAEAPGRSGAEGPPPLERALAVVEVPRGSFIKRELHEGGEAVDFISPLPCPFNYGFIKGRPGLDGDPADAVILGPRLALGEEVERAVVGVVRFWDAGEVDDKLVLSSGPIGAADALGLRAFFRAYALARRLLNVAKGERGRTAYGGLERRA